MSTRDQDISDTERLAELLESISAELEALSRPDGNVLTGDGPEATENRAVRETRAFLARSSARTIRDDVREAAQQARTAAAEARRASHQNRRGRAVRPGVADVPLTALERLCQQALGVTRTAVWAETAVPTAEGTVATASAGRLPAAVLRALASGPRAEVLAHGYPVAVDDATADARWPGLGSDDARAFLVLPLGIWGALTLAAGSADAFDDAARAVARELAAHGSGLLVRGGAAAAAAAATRARHLVVSASALLARLEDLDPAGGFDALLERAAAGGNTILCQARRVLDELGPQGDDETPRPPEPATLRRALAYLDQHAAEDVDVNDVAAAAGLGVRGLQMTFRRWRSTTPLGHLREIRLARAHEELRSADARETTVADVATRWHFTHPGRFSVTYRERYGCSPSETLRG